MSNKKYGFNWMDYPGKWFYTVLSVIMVAIIIAASYGCIISSPQSVCLKIYKSVTFIDSNISIQHPMNIT